jgi:hypothetical protein
VTSPEDGFIERMQGEPQVGDATLAELLQVFGETGVDGMAAAGQLTPQQFADWETQQPTPPPSGEPIPPANS